MEWPPKKSWTSTSLRVGYRHFVAINYGVLDKKRWVGLVSVLNGNARLRVSFEELSDSSKWNSGWLKLSREEANPSLENETCAKKLYLEAENPFCLHPSFDSGLLISKESPEIRPW